MLRCDTINSRMKMMMPRRLLSICVLSGLIMGSALALAVELRCSLCGETIPDKATYYQLKDGREIYCASCYARAPRCSVCKLPTASADIDPDTGACPLCLAKLPRCNACGKPILGTAYEFPYGKGFIQIYFSITVVVYSVLTGWIAGRTFLGSGMIAST